jgi:hypothetical protein
MICGNSTNCYTFVSYDGTNCYLFRVDSGSFNSIDFLGGTTVVANDVMRIYRDGNDVVATLNSVEILRATDTTYMTGNSGVFCFAGDLVLDDWTDGAGSVAANEYSDYGSPRNRPGRGPYSLGQYFRYRPDAITSATTQSLSVTAAGGLTLSGVSGINRTKLYSGAGGLLLAGASGILRKIVLSSAGGIQLGGAATVTTHESTRTVTAAGGLQLGGAAGYANFSVGGGGGEQSLAISVRIGI